MARKEHFIQEVFPGMLKGSALGIVPKGNRKEPAPANLTRGRQLDMWKTAKELRNSTLLDVEAAKIWRTGDDLNVSHEDMDKKVMDHKLSESRASGLYDSIKANGVSKPVYVSSNSRYSQAIPDGHHRIASANDIDPNMLIPVEHSP